MSCHPRFFKGGPQDSGRVSRLPGVTQQVITELGLEPVAFQSVCPHRHTPHTGLFTAQLMWDFKPRTLSEPVCFAKKKKECNIRSCPASSFRNSRSVSRQPLPQVGGAGQAETPVSRARPVTGPAGSGQSSHGDVLECTWTPHLCSLGSGHGRPGWGTNVDQGKWLIFAKAQRELCQLRVSP